MVYTVLYGLFSSYPIVFSRRNLDPTEIGLTYIPVLVGFFLIFGLTIWHYTRYRRLYHESLAGKRAGIEPEERLIPRMSSTSSLSVLLGGESSERVSLKRLPTRYLMDRLRADRFSYDIQHSIPGWTLLVCHRPSILRTKDQTDRSRFAWTSDPKYSIWLTMMR